MRTNNIKAVLKAALRVLILLPFAAVVAFGQQAVNLTAAPTTTTMPDGSTVPMWGYSCAATPVAGSTATCANLKPAAAGWSPVVITVPTGQSLTVNLTNNLSFLPAGSSTANTVPTSLMIVGQIGGGLGNTASTTPSSLVPHAPLTATWPIVGAAPAFTPPTQGPRVQSFSTEVAAGATTSLTWTALRPGTYLIESGTHPSIQGPMGLYGILVVTCAPTATAACTATAPAGTAYPGVVATATTPAVPAVTYNAEVPLIFSEIDPVQNNAVDTAVRQAGFTEMTMRTFGDQINAITVTSGGSGYTSNNPLVSFSGAAGSTGANASATVGAVISGITVNIHGAGYTTAPLVTITDSIGSNGAGAAATAIVTFALGSVTVPAAGTGTGYLAGDVIHFTGGGGSGAAATVGTVGTGGAITSVNITNVGSGYTTAPTVSSITSVAGVNAVLTPVLAATGVVGSINVTNGGSLYTSPTVSIAAPTGAGPITATATPSTAGAHGVVYAVTITSGGSGYHLAPSVTIAAPGGTGVQATANAIVGQACAGGLPCYPSAVNYTPLYYMINGVAFDKTHALASLFAVNPATGVASGTGTVLVRMVNAGVRMHVPAIVGSQTTGQTGTGAATTVTGFQLIAEDGNPLPGTPRVQSDVFMAAGKVYDVMINAPAAGAPALPVYDRELSLSSNAVGHDSGMLAYIGVNGSAPLGAPAAGATGTGVFAPAAVQNISYNSVAPCTTAPCIPLTVSDPSKGVISVDTNVYGVTLLTAPTKGTLTLNADGTFTYVPNAGWTAPDSFVYCANGSVTGTACSSHLTATATLGAGAASASITCSNPTFNANMATYLAVKTPGVLAGCKDGAGYPLTVALSGPNAPVATGWTLVADANGGFTASVPGAGVYTFTFKAQNSQGMAGPTVTATITFPAASGLSVRVLDGKTQDITAPITDYRWIIEEDRTFYVDPNCTTNSSTAIPGCPAPTTGPGGTSVPLTLGVNFHTSAMPYVAQGCTGPNACEGGQTIINPTTGAHVPAVCDVGNGACRPDPTGTTPATAQGFTPVNPSQVHLDPSKRYFISVLPGDAANPFYIPNAVGHGMSGAPIAAACTPAAGSTTCTGTFAPVTVLSEPSPYPTAKLSVFVFQDDFPLNGEHDSGGGNGVTVNSNNEPGLGQFQIHLWDAFGGSGDFTGQMSYDMFNQPLSNSLAGTLDPITGKDACPISKTPLISGTGSTDPTATGITGMIVTCPEFEAGGTIPSPLAGQAVIANLMPGRWGVIASPGADRIAKGEEWLQTNTLDGQRAHDSFTRIGEPSYFQEYGPAGYHVSIGFANPKIINSRITAVCNGTDPTITGTNCSNTITGRIVGERLSRTPDERLYGSGSHDAFYWTQCFVSFGDPDGEDFAFTKCDADGRFTLTGLPDGDWRITTFDQWDDQLVDGLSTPVRLGNATAPFCPGAGSSQRSCNLGDLAATQWQANIYTRTFIDDNKDGVSQADEAGIPLINTAIRLRDGSLANNLGTDFTGTANFNEEFPLFSWYTVETDTTRYKNTGTHVIYDAGGPADGSPSCGVAGYPTCGTSTIGRFLANTYDPFPLPADLSVPGAVYCSNADCTGFSIANGPTASSTSNHSTGRIDPPWVGQEGWQGFIGQNNFIEFGKAPYAPAIGTARAENGGIKGHVIYASTRPFDDPYMLVQTQWEPLVPNVTINLYQEGFAADGVTPTMTLVDTTKTSSWDDWVTGFRSDGKPNMNCPGQARDTGPGADLFFYTLLNQPNSLNVYNAAHGGPAAPALPYNSQYKCYDGMHNWNQIQPAPYDGAYAFPSIIGMNPTTGKPMTPAGVVAGVNGTPASLPGTNCTICVPNPTSATVLPDAPNYDPYRAGLPMLPAGKYVVEIVLPQGFELVKEEDKNILIGDNFIAPVTQQFGGLGNIFIVPDQAQVASAYNPNNPQNPTQSFGAQPLNQIVPGFVPEPVWPCVGETRIVPDFISLYPQSGEVAPFAGATRNLCDRKEVTLGDQMGAIAKFFIYTSTHIAGKFTGGITDDYTSEFDPFSPTFGEKFSPPNLPVSIKDWTGAEISRVYADHWGAYDGMTYSTWEVNPPNPTGYSPGMMVVCMNDPGPILDTRAQIVGPTGAMIANPTYNTMITDPLFTVGYSQFCYELPFMPGTTRYFDTPVVPTSAFAGAGYNNVDCAYPDATPAIKEVDSSDGIGPWVSAAGGTLTITALGDQMVPNNAYIGPSAKIAPYNAKTVKRHYGFGTAQGTVTIGGVTATVGTWNDATITVTVPPTGNQNGMVQPCLVQQQAEYSGTGVASTAYCGELVITTPNTAAVGQPSNRKQSIDTVTVTIGGKAPTHVFATNSVQSAIDAAAPGDMLIIDPAFTPIAAGTSCAGVTAATANCVATTAAHNELLLMWKPVRLQGVGAASSIINANTHPAGKLDAWRQQVNCLFGLALNGQPSTATNLFDPTNTVSCPGTGWNYFTPTPINPQVDRLPLEAVVGWDIGLNGNLAEMLQEPSLMGALEGAGITVLAKGVDFLSNPYDPALLAGFPAGTTLLQNIPETAPNAAQCSVSPNPFPSNYSCNPSSIDGLGITNSSQGGGGIFIHGWGHNLQVANNRIVSNAGTLSGGINLGQGEFSGPAIQGAGALNTPPGSCEDSPVANTVLPYCENVNVNIHNNDISLNSSTGDELFSATPAGAGGVSICTGSDYYKFNYNWVCGNLSSGDGGGIGHLGFSYNGDIEHNTIVFNQSTNPTIPTNGGGIIIMGTPDADLVCNNNTVIDQDCVPFGAPGGNPGNTPLAAVGPSDGVGPGLVINANLIMGNTAESGNGAGIAFQAANGSDMVAFPSNPLQWNTVNVTNNIIADNVGGWGGAGISLLDSVAVNIVNNTIVFNSSTASAGPLFTTLGAVLASTPPPAPGAPGAPCTTGCGVTTPPQPAGVVAIQNSAILTANLPATGPTAVTVTCPPGHFTGGGNGTNGNCRTVSVPKLENNIIWHNSSYNISVGALSPQFQQHVITLVNAFTGGTPVSQTSTGQCVAASYWDIGVRGDTGPANHNGGATLVASGSVLTPGGSSVNGANNVNGDPHFFTPYCDGSRTPPEAVAAGVTPAAAIGWQVPPGIADATVPNPIFNLTPAATVDEGNNWVNLRFGPLSMTNPAVVGGTYGNYGGGAPLGNYGIAAPSSASNRAAFGSAGYTDAPAYDFFDTPRKPAGSIEAGAVRLVSAGGSAQFTLSPSSVDFGRQPVRTTSLDQDLQVINSGTAPITINSILFSGTNPLVFRQTNNCGILAAGASCTINLTFAPGMNNSSPAPGAKTASLNVTSIGPGVVTQSVALTGFTTEIPPSAISFSAPTPVLTTAPATTATKTGTITVTNNATGPNAGPFVLTANPTVTRTGPNTGTFSRTGGTCVAGLSVAPGGSCTITVQYVPTTTGTTVAHVTITDTGVVTASQNGPNFNAN